jgi:hypothetical protein
VLILENRVGGVAQMVERLPGKFKTLSSIPVPPGKKKIKEQG